MDHTSASLRVVNANVTSWTQSTGTLSLNNPTAAVNVTCVAEGKPVTITFSSSIAERTDKNDFYVGEANTVTIRAKMGYIYPANYQAVVTNTAGSAVTTISTDCKTATISFTPNATGATEGCTITCTPDVLKYTITINAHNGSLNDGESSVATISEQVQEGQSIEYDFDIDFGYYFKNQSTESSRQFSGITISPTSAAYDWDTTQHSTVDDVYWDTTGDGQMHIQVTAVRSNVTVDINPFGAQFTVHYNSTETATLPQDTTVTYDATNQKVIPLSAATRTFYQLAGWSRNSGATTGDWEPTGNVDINSIEFPSSANRIKQVYAVWSESLHTVTVTYNNCHELSKTLAESCKSVTVGADTPSILNVCPDWGYKCDYDAERPYEAYLTTTGGASVSTDSSGDKHFFDTIALQITATADGTLTISPEGVTFTVYYDKNDAAATGTLSPTSKLYAGSGTTISLATPEPSFQKQYWHALGTWKDKNNELYPTGSNIAIGNKLFDRNTDTYMVETLYAQWEGNNYEINVSTTNCSTTSGSATHIRAGSSAVVTLTPTAGYTLPSGYSTT